MIHEDAHRAVTLEAGVSLCLSLQHTQTEKERLISSLNTARWWSDGWQRSLVASHRTCAHIHTDVEAFSFLKGELKSDQAGKALVSF